jgi:hypothetical protein
MFVLRVIPYSIFKLLQIVLLRKQPHCLRVTKFLLDVNNTSVCKPLFPNNKVPLFSWVCLGTKSSDTVHIFLSLDYIL